MRLCAYSTSPREVDYHRHGAIQREVLRLLIQR